ncbi:PhoH family protein [Dehalobacter sp. DCM]|uniref:PhoH family protein n=1 Tax=Dehalobacter sp. DCM TaxID=2907827 RepID=UPI0030813BB2|nr:PhoH family protein [Dehalobacter sp. DCM]
MQKTYVLDTSVLLHDPNALYNFEENTVVIPYAVLEELAKKKSQVSNIGQAVRDVIKNLDDLRKQGNLAVGIQLPSGGMLRIELNNISPMRLPTSADSLLIDNRILNVTLNLAKTEDFPVILVTKDMTMRVKADTLGIRCEDYHNDKVFLPPVEADIETIRLNEVQINELFNKGVIPAEKAVVPNCCIRGVIADGSYLPLVSSPTGEMLHYTFTHREQTWGIAPKNQEQSWALTMLNNPEITLVNLMGPAGTGKTLLALASGLEQTVNHEVYNRILCARPLIPFGKDIGYLPGEKDDKVRPYMQPIYDNLELLLNPKRDKGKGKEAYVDSAIDLLKKKGQLDIEVLTYIRGRSIPNQFIIIDEAQNLSAHEIKTIVTRAGEGSKIVLCGDPDQIDHPYLDKESNGMTHAAHRLKGESFYGQVRLVQGERSRMATIAAEKL